MDLGFYQSKEDRAVWSIEKSGWHDQLPLDTLLNIDSRHAFVSQHHHHFQILLLCNIAVIFFFNCILVLFITDMDD